MLKLGVTYNLHNTKVKQVIERVADKIDFIEIKNLELSLLQSKKEILKRFPMSMHVQYLSKQEKPTTLNLVSDRTKEIISDENSELYRAFDFLNPFVVSFHLGFSSKLVGTQGIDSHNYAISEVLSESEVFESITESLNIISEMLRKRGYNGEMLIENLDYHPTGAYEYICEPEFISKIARRTGYKVLLDLAHTIISSHALEMDVIDFIEKIGIDLIYEVHVNSPLHEDGKWYDLNEPFYNNEEGKEIIEYLIERNDAILLNIECEKEIAQQIKILMEMVWRSEL